MRSPSEAAARARKARWGRKQIARAVFTALALGLVPALLVTPAALAATGGAARPAPAPAGGPAPVVLDVRCTSNPGGPCVETHRAERSGSVRVVGRNLGRAAQRLFYGRKGERDDALAPVSAAARSATAAVPAAARSGPVAVLDASGRRSLRWTGLVIDDPLRDFGTYQPLGAPQPVRVAVSKPRRIYYGGAQKAVFTYDVVGGSAMDLRVNLLRASDGQVVQTWDRPATAPGAPQRVIWSGSTHGKALPEGRYAFRVSGMGASAAALRSAPSAPGDESVSLYGHVFPVRGKHDFGGRGAGFGSGRTGHSHQGQDVFAACGTPLVAARAGTVKFAGFHAAAGYYVVVDGKGTDTDYAYMHLRERAAVQVGDAVYTGQDLGEVGETGNARGCHLHFEMWSGPGWYDGGRPFNPMPDLKRWDRTS